MREQACTRRHVLPAIIDTSPLAANAPAAGTVTVDALSQHFCEHVAVNLTWPSAHTSRRKWLTSLCPPLGVPIGAIPVGQLRKSHAIHWYRWVARETSHCTAAKALSHLSAVCREAEAWDLRPPNSNPCLRWGSERQSPTPRERVLSLEELRAAFEAIQRVEDERAEWALRWREQADLRRICTYSATAAIRLLFLTGARRSEIRALRWEHVNVAQRMLQLPRSKTGQRRVPLCDHALALLDLQRARCEHPALRDLPWAFPGRPPKSGARVQSHVGDLRAAWRRVIAHLGDPDLRLNDLRRSWMVHALDAGAALEEVSKAAGHKTVTTTQRAYMRFTPHPRALRAADAFSDRLAASGVRHPTRRAG